MARFIELKTDGLDIIRNVDERLMSYNIEMAEVTGGTFWKAYTKEQIAGTEEVPPISMLTQSFTDMAKLMQYYPPIDLSNVRLIEMAKQFGPVWIRVSGSWATKTYYDFEGVTKGIVPEGYQNILTRKQWIGVLEFVKAVGGKLLISVSNCAGDHPNGGPLDLTQAKKIFAFSRDYGVDIDAAEFMNEPNMLEVAGTPDGYTAADYARDQDIFNGWVRKNYPSCLIVGPCTTGDPSVIKPGEKNVSAGIGSLMKVCTTHDLMTGSKIRLDIFSYHYYNGVSERLASAAPDAHWNSGEAHTDAYLAVAPSCVKNHIPLRDQYVPGGQIWVTESGDAGGGGDTWASTYLDVFRTLNELGSFSELTDGVIFHNTLASSDYGFLQHRTFEPRPNYFAALLWTRLMGTVVYDCGNLAKKEAHVYCHSRKDQEPGVCYLLINNSLTDDLIVQIPKEADRYTLSGETVRSDVMLLNGRELNISGTALLPDLSPVKQEAGTVRLMPGTCTFLVM
jgi:heparanase 1